MRGSFERAVSSGPPALQTLAAAAGRAADGLQQWGQGVGKQCGRLAAEVARIGAQLPLLEIMKKDRPGGLHRIAVASISGHLAGRQPLSGVNPVCELAMNRDELKARISVIPVYTVANGKNEFVLVSAEGQKQVGLLFMSEQGAVQLIEKMKKENPRLGRGSKVIRVALDDVYELLTKPRGSLGDVVFRFVPDMKQVANAMEVFQSAGVPTKTITGVPVFQAEGLFIATETAQSTPIFLNKDDLDKAVISAQKSRLQRVESETKKLVQKLDEEAAEARKKAEEGSINEAKKWTAAAERAEARAEDIRVKLSDQTNNPAKPRVEVGSLEEVISRMEGDKSGAWSNVMFVRSGVMLSQEKHKKKK